MGGTVCPGLRGRAFGEFRRIGAPSPMVRAILRKDRQHEDQQLREDRRPTRSNRSACGEITRWLRENAEHADLVTEYEGRQCLLNAGRGAGGNQYKWQGRLGHDRIRL